MLAWPEIQIESACRKPQVIITFLHGGSALRYALLTAF